MFWCIKSKIKIMKFLKQVLRSFLIFAIISSCTLEPKYNRPKLDLPFKQPEVPKEKITTISWERFFESEDLQRIIKLALKNNRDLKIANLNIEAVEATHSIARANLLPSFNAQGLETRQRAPKAFASFTPKKQFRANVALAAYEIDFFGRLRSLKKSALENFLASKQARNITQISLISQVVNSYAQLLLDAEVLDIMKENLKLQNDRYNFIELRYKNGIDSQDDLLNAKTLLENAKNNSEIYIKLVEQDKNALMLLTGVFNENSLPKISSINDIKINEDLLDFIPSESLLSRPDIQQAEHQLKSANANIGAARAAFFPSISLSGTYGYASRDLSSLFDSRTWAFTPQINIPIFSGGRNIANLNIANLQKKIEIAQYEKTIQTAFSEVLDQLAERKSVTNQLEAFDEILKAREKSYKISKRKHNQGINSGLGVIDEKLSFLIAKQNQFSIKKEYIANLIALYKVLGGGSKIE